MNRPGLCRSSLKITRSGDHAEANRFCVEVWNPFVHKYEPVNSVEEGVTRVGDLANLISRMWVARHPKRDVLIDIPVAEKIDGLRWAELRINATNFRSYDTRSYDRLTWARAAGLKQAAVTICSKLGYVLQNETAPLADRILHSGWEAPDAIDLTREQLAFLADSRKGMCRATAAQDASPIYS